MTKPLLRFGIHNFLNASPLLLPLKEQGVNMGFQVIIDSPAVLADRLKSSDLDLAMIPSVEYFKQGHRGSRTIICSNRTNFVNRFFCEK